MFINYPFKSKIIFSILDLISSFTCISLTILSWAWITVVWSLPPNSSPILGSDKSVYRSVDSLHDVRVLQEWINPLGINDTEVQLIDSDINISVAKKLGIIGIRYIDIDDLKIKLNDFLNNDI